MNPLVLGFNYKINTLIYFLGTNFAHISGYLRD